VRTPEDLQAVKSKHGKNRKGKKGKTTRRGRGGGGVGLSDKRGGLAVSGERPGETGGGVSQQEDVLWQVAKKKQRAGGGTEPPNPPKAKRSKKKRGSSIQQMGACSRKGRGGVAHGGPKRGWGGKNRKGERFETGPPPQLKKRKKRKTARIEGVKKVRGSPWENLVLGSKKNVDIKPPKQWHGRKNSGS